MASNVQAETLDPDDPLPQDEDQVVVLDGDGHGTEATKDKEIIIGQPDSPDYNIHNSVVYTHNYFRRKNDETAVCLTCEQLNKSIKDKTMMRKTVFASSQGSTSGKIDIN